MPRSAWMRHSVCMDGFYCTRITILMSGICSPNFCSSVPLQGALWMSSFGELFRKSSINVEENVDLDCSLRGCRSAWVVKMTWPAYGYPTGSIREPVNFAVYVGGFLPGIFCQLCWVTLETRNRFPPPPRCSVSCPELRSWLSQLRGCWRVRCLPLCKNN